MEDDQQYPNHQAKIRIIWTFRGRSQANFFITCVSYAKENDKKIVWLPAKKVSME